MAIANITNNILTDSGVATSSLLTTDTSQAITANKSFTVGFSLASEGLGNQTSFFRNTSSIFSGSGGSNIFGFNNSNNIYFGKGLNNGGVLQWNNTTATRYYTLPDADGTIALTSNIPANAVGGTGTTNTLSKFTASTTIGNSSITDDGTIVSILNSSFTDVLRVGSTTRFLYFYPDSGSVNIMTGAGFTGSGITFAGFSNYLDFNTNSLTRMRLTTAGNLVLGPNPFTDSGARLQVSGAATFSSSVRADAAIVSMQFNPASDAIIAAHNSVNVGMEMRYFPNLAQGFIDNTYPVTAGQVFGDIYFRQNVSGTMTSRMMIQARSGNVGIGTLNPDSTLEVAGGGVSSLLLSGNLTDVTRKFAFIQGKHYTNSEEPIAMIGIDSQSSSSILYIGGGLTSSLNAATEISFQTAANNTTVTGTPRMTITSVGNVGIGTASPTERFEVAGLNGNIRLYGRSGISNNSISSNLYYNGSAWVRDNASFGAAEINFGSSNDTIIFSTNSATSGSVTERMRITSSGNVGIGETNPTQPLQIGGTGNILLAAGGTLFSSGRLFIRSGSGQSFDFGANNTNSLMTLTSGGNLLIGTQTDNGGKLQLGGFSGAVNQNNGIKLTNNVGTIVGLEIGGSNDSYIGTISASNFSIRTGNTARMQITSGGIAVVGHTAGVGTNFSPPIQVKGGAGVGNGFGIISGNNEMVGGLQLASSGSNSLQITVDPDNLRPSSEFTIQIDGTERMRVTSSGFLKASDTGNYAFSTGSFHELLSSATGNNIVYFYHTAANPYGPYLRFSGAAPNNSTNYYLYFDDTSTVRFRVNSNGGISNYQANDVNLSDERTKKDIEPLGSYWDKFKEIEIVKFKYKDQTHDDFNIGVIAQQVEAVAPEFVDVDGWDNNANGNDVVSEEEPLKSIYTADLYHATIKVLQEAMAKIEKLETEINKLKNT